LELTEKPKSEPAQDDSPVGGDLSAVIFDIQKFAVHDGPGIRTLVFFKGCPLQCAWCSNPESQSAKRQLVFFPNRCIGCLHCVEACGHQASRVDEDGELRFDRGRCIECGECVETCYADARVLLGRRMTVEQVMREIRKDLVFYRTSGGGVTLGGGEATVWSQFAAELLRALKAEGIATALETCGHVSYRDIESLLPDLDLVFYDVKLMDPARHRLYTGVGNERILANLKRLAAEDIEVIVRIPVVPGVNDDADNIGATADFVASNRIAAKIELLPYHSLAQDKYMRLGWEYSFVGLEPPSAEHMEELAGLVRSRGLDCQVGG
jgi:pyruvate formate lyase activating enzyme